MSLANARWFAGAGALLLMASCTEVEPTTVVVADLSVAGGPAVGTAVGAFEAYWPSRASAELAQRVAAVSRALMNGPKSEATAFQAFTDQHAGSTDRWSELTNYGGAPVHVEYYPGRDDLRVSNLTLEDDASLVTDVGEAGARKVAANAIAMLASDGVIDASRFDLASAEVSHKMHGISRSTEQPAPAIIQYRFNLRRRINGIEFAHNGLRVAVHRNGSVASIRVGGAEIKSAVSSGAEQPLGRGSAFATKLTSTDANARHRKDFPDARGVKSRLMYVFPDGEDSGIIEPRQMVLFSRPHTPPGGQTVLSKGQYIAYSLRSATDAPKLVSGVPKPSPTADIPQR